MAKGEKHGFEEKESIWGKMDDKEQHPQQDNKEESRTEEAEEFRTKEEDAKEALIRIKINAFHLLNYLSYWIN